jgi:glycine cleavage system H protein
MSTFYSKDHEWVLVEGSAGIVGITSYAAHQLGDITFVELPKKGKIVKQFEALCSIESVKAASDIYCPLSGKVLETNAALDTEPQVINTDAQGEGWIAKLELANPSETSNLMDEAAYRSYLKTLE